MGDRTVAAGRVGPRADRRPTVDVPAALRLVGVIVAWLSTALLAPLVVAVALGESARPFVVALAVGIGLGVGLRLGTRRAGDARVREGFLVVASVWILASLVGCLPYIIEGGDVSDPVNAYFEAMAGFTATGSTVMGDIESHGRAILLWRAVTQFLGGVGILVLALAVLPRLAVGGRQLMESEVHAPEFEKLAPRMRAAAGRLWLFFALLVLVQVTLLAGLGVAGLAPGMDLYNAVAHGLTTLSAGGFSPETRSIEPFGAWAQWAILVFMVIAGTNIALWYRSIFRGGAQVRRDEELRVYLALIAAVAALIAVDLYRADLHEGHAAVRHALFQTVSIITGTGYASTDFARWPILPVGLLLALMFVGGCGGSPTGALKIFRLILVTRVATREISSTVHPEMMIPVRLSGRVVPDRVVRGAVAYTLLYLGVFVLGTVAILVDVARGSSTVSLLEAVSAAAATIGNVGPGFGFLGPMGSYEPFSDLSTGILTVLMWAGRMELLPVLVLLTRSYWRA
jgi:trk system potassium uptake protein TrkH